MKSSLPVAGLLAVVLWGVMALVPRGHAQETPAPTEGTLDNDSLHNLLDTMGYEPKKLSKGWLISVKRDTWTLNMQLVLSADLRKVGINANLGVVKDPDAITASQWRALLISNGDIDPSAFYFDKDQKKLYLHRSFDNRAVTAHSMRTEIENFGSNVQQTEDLWKFTE